MEKFISTLLLGLLAAVIGAMIQGRTWRHRSLVELKEKEYNEARKIIEEISSALDRRLSAQRSYTNSVLSGSASNEVVTEYKKATTDWMGNFSSNKSKLHHLFGRDTVLEFEDGIQNKLQYASAIVSLGRREGVDRLCSRDKKLFNQSENKLNFIQHEIYRFLNELNQRVSNGEIGRTRAINNLNENDPTMISRVYLVRRIFGLEGNIRRTYW